MEKKVSILRILIILIILFAIVAAIAIPSLIRSKIAANEGAAAGSLKRLNGMLATYKKKGYYGQGRRYPTGAKGASDLNPGKYVGMYWEGNCAGQPVTLIGYAEMAADLRADGDTDMKEDTGSYITVIAITTLIPQDHYKFTCYAKQGYWFGLFMEMGGSGTAAYSYDLTQARNHYGMQAIPEHYGSSGEMTFIINEEGTVYSMDRGKTGYMPTYPTVTPADHGWKVAQ